MQIVRRLVGFLRPYRGGVARSSVLAAGAMGMTVLIPYLTGRAIDSIRSHSKHELVVLAIVIFGAGLLRLALSVGRRLIAGPASLGGELDLRSRRYAQPQRLG